MVRVWLFLLHNLLKFRRVFAGPQRLFSGVVDLIAMPDVNKKFHLLKCAEFVVVLFQFLNLNFAVGFMMGIRNNLNCVSSAGKDMVSNCGVYSILTLQHILKLVASLKITALSILSNEL